MRLEASKETVFLELRGSKTGHLPAAGVRAIHGAELVDEMLTEGLLEEVDIDLGNGFFLTALKNTDKARR